MTVAGSADDLLDEERSRLAAALFVCDYDSVGPATKAGFWAERADTIAPLSDAVSKAQADNRYVVIAVAARDGRLVEYLANLAPDAAILDARWPSTCSSFASFLRFAETPDLQREIVVDWLVGRDEDGPHVWTATEPTRSGSANVFRPFPLHALPASCRAMVEHGAAAQGVDPAYWSVPLLGIAAGCIGSSRRIELKPGWEEPAVLWTALVAPSGSGKSPPLRTLLQPVRDHDRKLREQSETARHAAELEVREWEGRRARKSDGGSVGPRPEVPPRRCCVVQDITIEALASRLHDNPRGLLVGVDELGQWLRSFQRYRGNQGSDEQQWLSMHNADPVIVDRQSGTPICVPHAAVSIVGTIQPQVARKLLAAR